MLGLLQAATALTKFGFAALPALLLLALHWYLQPTASMRNVASFLQIDRIFEDDGKVETNGFAQKEMDKMRLRLTAGFLGISTHMIAVVIVIDGVLTTVGFGGIGFFPLLLAYVSFSCLKLFVEKYEPSHRRQLHATSVFMGLWLLRVIMSDSITTVISGSARLALRTCLLNFTLDARFAGIWNFIFFVVSCGAVASKKDTQVELGTYIAGEMASLVMSIILSEFVSLAVNSSVKLGLIAKGLGGEMEACRRLLSVLCDAQVLLGADFNILKHCDGLQNLLMTGGVRGSLSGTSFLQRIAVPDQPRFQAFIEQNLPASPDDSSSQASSSDESSLFRKTVIGPPASLKVHLTDALGILMPAELYHINVPDVLGEKINHLIGISESAAKSTGDSEGSSVHRETIPEASRPASSERPEIPASLHGAESVSSSSSRSSVSSQSSSSSAASLARPRPFPEMRSAEIWFDPMEENLPIHKVEFNFQKIAEGDEEPSGMASLMDWLHPHFVDGCRTGIQNSVNALFSEEGEPEEVQLGPVAFCASGVAGQVLKAQTVRVTLVAEQSEDPDKAEVEGGDANNQAHDEADADDDISIVAKLELSCFSISHMRSPSSRSSSSQGHRRRGGRSVDRSAAQPMDSIPESSSVRSLSRRR